MCRHVRICPLIVRKRTIVAAGFGRPVKNLYTKKASALAFFSSYYSYLLFSSQFNQRVHVVVDCKDEQTGCRAEHRTGDAVVAVPASVGILNL